MIVIFTNSFCGRLMLLFFILLSMVPKTSAQVERVEPPNWWTGMACPELQIMFYGENIGDSEIRIDYPGLRIKQVFTPANKNYLFLDLEIDSSANPGFVAIELSKEGFKENIRYELKERMKDSAGRKGFNSSDVIYLVVPDRFANGNPDNDTLKSMKEGLKRTKRSGRHGGDLMGLSEHADYFHNMGYTALWTTPVLENNQPQASYHGYSITDYYRVDPRLGSNSDYAELSAKLQEKGIKLIMDMVFNHCGSEHWWMKDLPFPDWINSYPEMVITNHRRTVHQDSHASEYDRARMTDGWFVPSMPDLNQKNPYLARYLIQNSIWWIEYANLAGIRMDTYPYADKGMMSEWTGRIMDEYPYFSIVGEEWSENPAIVSYWQRGKINADGYKSYLPSLMDFPLQAALVKALTVPEGWGSGWINLYELLAMDFLYPDPNSLVVLGDNHDMARFFMQLGKDTALFKMGLAYILTTRGIPQIYYGTEILLTHSKNNDHGEIRKDFPGGWQGDSINAFTGEGLNAKQAEIMEYLRNLLIWRKNCQVIHSGKLVHFAPENSCYVYFRILENKTVMIVLNKNTRSEVLQIEKFREVLKDYSYGRDIISGKEYNLETEIVSPPKQALILELY